MTPDPFPQIIDLNEPAKKNHFPLLIQFGVLMFILASIFGTLFFTGDKPELAEETLPNPQQSNASVVNSVPQKLENIPLRATAAYVWDVRAQRALFTKNESAQLPLASITKLMTALLAYELIEQDVTTSVSVNAIRQEGSSGLSAGEQLDIQELTELALIASSNDAAYELAASVGELLGERDGVSQFVTGMNIRAAELGLETLEFKNMTGLDVSASQAGAIGSAQDISFLMEYILDNYPEILAPTQKESTRVYNSAGQYHDAENTNEIVSKIPNLLGSKTGYTDLAGGNLTIAFDLGLNRPIIVTVLGSTREERFSDVLKLVAAVQASVE